MIRPLVLPLAVCFISCSSRLNQNPTTKDTLQTSNLVKQDTTTHQSSMSVKNFPGDTLIVDQRCAVFYVADSTQAEKRRVPTDTTYGGVDGADDDNAYYLGQASEFLEKQKVKIVNVYDKKYILFKSQGNVSKVINTDTLHELVDVYLFDPRKGLIKADIINIEGDFTKLLK